MENKNKVLLTVIGAATLLVALVGATFAYFSATSTTDAQTVTTGTSSITLNASKNTVANIKPTTFSKATADTNTDVVKISLTVSGTTQTSGVYDIIMHEPAITLNANKTGGSVSDIKYAVYQGSTEKVAPTSFKGTVADTTILSDVEYAAGTLSGTYDVYVWIENKTDAQDALQEVSFDLSFTADAQSVSQ
jgi:predicted ribosomally synthesized peptide with SipW-like signal peptide